MAGPAMWNVQGNRLLAEASALVHAAGGITSLAHPRYYGVAYEELIQHLKVSVLLMPSKHSIVHIQMKTVIDLWKLAQKHGLGGHRRFRVPLVQWRTSSEDTYL